MQAKFVISAEKLSQCPASNLPEIPLLGRSNVGKSSFINTLANQKKLAKTSNTPGKTRLINYFNFSDKFMIADLPGYGYAKISAQTQNQWQKNLEEYLLNREQIKCLVQFIDSRHEIQKNDYQMREWVIAHDLPIITIVTKVDKISSHNKIIQAVNYVKREFGGEVFPFSAESFKYNEPILKFLSEIE
jgi:GTP-binding protein